MPPPARRSLGSATTAGPATKKASERLLPHAGDDDSAGGLACRRGRGESPAAGKPRLGDALQHQGAGILPEAVKTSRHSDTSRSHLQISTSGACNYSPSSPQSVEIVERRLFDLRREQERRNQIRHRHQRKSRVDQVHYGLDVADRATKQANEV